MFTRKPWTDAEKWERIRALYAQSKKRFPDVPDVTVEEFDKLCETEDVVLVDVRKPEEQEVSMIPGAVRSSELEGNLEAFAGKTLVTYCTIGHRSGLYAQKLQASGFRAFNFAGAILSWTHAGRELADSNGETRRVHVAGPRWSLEASDYEPTW